MPEQLKTKQVTAPSIKTDDLPDEVAKAAEGKDIDRWFYATVEVPDREKDIVRVEGIDLKAYAQNGPLKFISSHSRKAGPDGRLPVVGKAVEWVRTRHKASGATALAVGIKFAPTDLGNEMKALYDGDFLTDVSIGFEPLDAVQIAGGGYDYTKSAIAELSACINGMNQFSGVLRALEAEEGEKTIETPVTVKADEAVAAIKGIDALLEQLTERIKGINKALDDIECSVEAVKAEAAGQSSGSPPQHPERKKSIDQAKLDALLALL